MIWSSAKDGRVKSACSPQGGLSGLHFDPTVYKGGVTKNLHSHLIRTHHQTLKTHQPGIPKVWSRPHFPRRPTCTEVGPGKPLTRISVGWINNGIPKFRSTPVDSSLIAIYPVYRKQLAVELAPNPVGVQRDIKQVVAVKLAEQRPCYHEFEQPIHIQGDCVTRIIWVRTSFQ